MYQCDAISVVCATVVEAGVHCNWQNTIKVRIAKNVRFYFIKSGINSAQAIFNNICKQSSNSF